MQEYLTSSIDLQDPENSLDLEELSRAELEDLFASLRESSIRKARINLWAYCCLMQPDYYTEDKVYLRRLCEVLQKLYDRRLRMWGKLKFRKLIINMPPRHGKTRTLVLFCAWALGRFNEHRIIVCSYNDDEASDFSRYVRDTIAEHPISPEDIVHTTIFPECRLKDGQKSFEKWALEGQYFSYKGAGIGGSVTGKGATIAIVDDPMKNAEEALSDTAKKRVMTWYRGTWLSRREANAIEIVNMTPWATDDLCGYLKTTEGIKEQWYVFELPATPPDEKNWRDYHDGLYNGSGEMLNAEQLSRDAYDELSKTMLPHIKRANYDMQPIDLEGRLYKHFRTYEYKELPKEFTKILSYTDTADKGDNYLCSIVAGLWEHELYVLDLIYTQSGMETTEPAVARMLDENAVKLAKIESNNGGRGFARSVEKILLDEPYHNGDIQIIWFHQTKNKQARIRAASTFVMNHIYMPENWQERFPLFHSAVTTFSAIGKNQFDDAEDTLSGLREMVQYGSKLSKRRRARGAF